MGAPETKADQWTRGKAALPVYEDAKNPDDVPEYSETAPPVDSRTLSASSATPAPRAGTSFTADGKTSEQIIQEAKERNEAKKKEKGGWKQTLKKGTEFALLAQ